MTKTDAILRPIVLIPALNEEQTIGAVVREVRRYCDYPIIVINDNSTDGTMIEARRHGAKVISLALRMGAWGATQTGIRYALRRGYNLVITMDADGQHDPRYIDQLMSPVLNGKENVVIGACTRRGSRLRRIAWHLLRIASGIRLDDLTSGFRVYDAKAITHLASKKATFLDFQDVGVLSLLLSKGCDVGDIEVEMRSRSNGGSRVFYSWLMVIYYMMHTLLLGLTKRKIHHYNGRQSLLSAD